METASPLKSQTIGINELWLHYIWKQRILPADGLLLDDKRTVSIKSVGWYNRGWGPDFKDGRLQIEDDIYFGDIEIHLNKSFWERHRHNADEVYNKVILHVYLFDDTTETRNQLGLIVPSLNLRSPQFDRFWARYRLSQSISIKELPGACGMFLEKDNYLRAKKIIYQASERRLIRKSVEFKGSVAGGSVDRMEDDLFAHICKSVGYSSFSQPFFQIAHVYPYSKLTRFFRKSVRDSRIEIISRWLGSLSILDSIDSLSIHHTLRREWLAFQSAWRKIGDRKVIQSPKAVTPSRPLNNPVRRLIGLFYHLESTQFQGLFKSWLRFLNDCQIEMERGKKCVPNIRRRLDKLFPQPDWDPLNHLISVSSEKRRSSAFRLIGERRQLTVLVNSVIPFFLAWSKAQNNRELERTLFSLFMLLPGKSENRKTRFMEQRLFSIHPDFEMRKNLSYQQGLIQLHDDCCRSFYEGCGNCSFIRLIR